MRRRSRFNSVSSTSFATVFILGASFSGAAFGQSLTWQGTSNPNVFGQFTGNWDTTTQNWSDGSNTSGWVNGDTAVFSANSTDDNSQGITIDDPSGTVDVAGINLNVDNFSGFDPNPAVSILANGNETLTLTNPDVFATNTGAPSNAHLSLNINAPIAGTVGIDNQTTSQSIVQLFGLNTYTGNTIGDFQIVVGSSFNNTAFTNGGIVTVGNGAIPAGATGPGTAGATLSDQSVSIGTMGFDTAAKFVLNQESGFTGPALTLNGTSFDFGLSDSGLLVSQLDVNGPGDAQVLNPRTPEQISLTVSNAESLTPGVYPLIDVPAGGLDAATWEFAGPETYVAGNDVKYGFSISNTDTEVLLTIASNVPEPASMALMALGAGMLLRRRNRRSS